MHIVFESRDPQGSALRDLAVARLRFVMRRLVWLVPRAKVVLSDTNGPRGGVDKRCQLELKTANGGTLVITATASDWRGALDSALARASRVLVRVWRRTQTQSRRNLPEFPADRHLDRATTS